MKIDVELTIKTFDVLSSSEIGTYRTVELTNKGRLFCDCPAGSFNKPCRHKKLISEQLEKNDHPTVEKKIQL